VFYELCHRLPFYVEVAEPDATRRRLRAIGAIVPTPMTATDGADMSVSPSA
jgi:hypothetical protein